MTACCCGSGVRLCIVSESLCRAAEGDMETKERKWVRESVRKD